VLLLLCVCGIGQQKGSKLVLGEKEWLNPMSHIIFRTQLHAAILFPALIRIY